MDQVIVQGQTVLLPQHLNTILVLAANQEFRIPNGWYHQALVFEADNLVGICAIWNGKFRPAELY